MNHQYNWSVGSPAESAFQTSYLNGSGLSVSIDALLTPSIRKAVISILEKNIHTHKCDSIANLKDILDIFLESDKKTNIFIVIHSPILGFNPAHADIKFSDAIKPLSKAQQKKYRLKLMAVFK